MNPDNMTDDRYWEVIKGEGKTIVQTSFYKIEVYLFPQLKSTGWQHETKNPYAYLEIETNHPNEARFYDYVNKGDEYGKKTYDTKGHLWWKETIEIPAPLLSTQEERLQKVIFSALQKCQDIEARYKRESEVADLSLEVTEKLIGTMVDVPQLEASNEETEKNT
jgi:hypothetical protein